MTRSISTTVTLLVLAVLVGCTTERSDDGGGFGGMPPMPVETAEVLAEGMTDEFSVVGSLAANFEITVVAEIAAVVEALPFGEGLPLEKGDPIARLDAAQLTAEVQRADAIVQQQRATYGRVRTIVEENAGSAQDLDDAAANLAIAEANLALMRARLAKAHVTAPFSGIAGARLVSPGSYLRAGDAITELAQIDRLRVNFSAPELYLGRLRLGAPVQVRTMAYPDLVLEGTVDVINPVLDRASRSARIVAHIDNLERRLRPGMSAEVTVVLDKRPHALTVPSEAVFFQGQQAFVYTVAADSTVAMAPVFLGTRDVERVEVTGGLEAGQSVVRAGHQKLFPGARVMPIGGDDPGAPPAATEPDAEGASS